jgi:hypothetical protein
VIYRLAKSRRKMICSTDANASEDELEKFSFSMRKDREDVFEPDSVERFIEPLASRNPNARVAHRVVTSERSVRVEGLAIVKNLVDVLVALDSTHLQETVGESEEVRFPSFRPKQWLPKVTDFGLCCGEDRFDSREVFESGNILQRLEASWIGDSLDSRRWSRLEHTMVNMLGPLTQLHSVEMRLEQVDPFSIQLRKSCGGGLFLRILLVFVESLASWLALFDFAENINRLGIRERTTRESIRHVVWRWTREV